MRRIQAVMACVAISLVLAACGGSEEPSGGNGGSGGQGGQNGSASSNNGGNGGGEAASEEQYAQGQYTLTEDGAADDQYEDAEAGDLPFPLPPEAEIVRAGQSQDMAYGVLMNVPSGQEAYEFYIQSLPDAGFEILRDSRAAQSEGGENTNAEGGESEDRPFSAVVAVEGNDLRGRLRFDEERVIVGMSAAAVEDAEAAAAEREERIQAREQTAGQNEGREAPTEDENQ